MISPEQKNMIQNRKKKADILKQLGMRRNGTIIKLGTPTLNRVMAELEQRGLPPTEANILRLARETPKIRGRAREQERLFQQIDAQGKPINYEITCLRPKVLAEYIGVLKQANLPVTQENILNLRRRLIK